MEKYKFLLAHSIATLSHNAVITWLLKYNPHGPILFILSMVLVIFVRVRTCGVRIITDQVKWEQLLLVGIAYLFDFSMYAFISIMLYICCMIAHCYYEDGSNNITATDIAYMTTLVFAFLFFSDNYRRWIMIIATFAMYTGDQGSAFFIASNLLLAITYQNSILFAASLLDSMTVLKPFVEKTRVYSIQDSMFYVKILLGYQLVVLIYSIIIWEDLWAQLFHMVCIWSMCGYLCGAYVIGIPDIIVWSSKMNVTPHMVFRGGKSTYYAELNLLTHYFLRQLEITLHIEDRNRDLYKDITDDMYRKYFDSVNIAADKHGITITDSQITWQNDCDKFFEKLMMSNVGATFTRNDNLLPIITIPFHSVATIDIYYQIKNIIGKFSVCDDVGKVIIGFIMAINVRDRSRKI